jgi:hypothetical protein
MKRYLAAFSFVVVLGLILVIGFRLSQDAIGVIIGIGLGVLATLPTSLVLIYMMVRREQSGAFPSHQPPGLPAHHQPPVIIVNGGQQPGLPAGSPLQSVYPASLPGQRSFTIVGEEITDV